MIDFGLKPCPLCGGEPEVVNLTQGVGLLNAVIKCPDCGLTLDWKTKFRESVSRSGNHKISQTGPGPIEAWNRREGVDCENCGARIHSDQVSALPNCNNCDKNPGCQYLPKPGAYVRINCPLWEHTEELPEI